MKKKWIWVTQTIERRRITEALKGKWNQVCSEHEGNGEENVTQTHKENSGKNVPSQVLFSPVIHEIWKDKESKQKPTLSLDWRDVESSSVLPHISYSLQWVLGSREDKLKEKFFTPTKKKWEEFYSPKNVWVTAFHCCLGYTSSTVASSHFFAWMYMKWAQERSRYVSWDRSWNDSVTGPREQEKSYTNIQTNVSCWSHGTGVQACHYNDETLFLFVRKSLQPKFPIFANLIFSSTRAAQGKSYHYQRENEWWCPLRHKQHRKKRQHIHTKAIFRKEKVKKFHFYWKRRDSWREEETDPISLSFSRESGKESSFDFRFRFLVLSTSSILHSIPGSFFTNFFCTTTTPFLVQEAKFAYTSLFLRKQRFPLFLEIERRYSVYHFLPFFCRSIPSTQDMLYRLFSSTEFNSTERKISQSYGMFPFLSSYNGMSRGSRITLWNSEPDKLATGILLGWMDTKRDKDGGSHSLTRKITPQERWRWQVKVRGNNEIYWRET